MDDIVKLTKKKKKWTRRSSIKRCRLVAVMWYLFMWFFLIRVIIILVRVACCKSTRRAACAIKQILWWSNISWAGRSFRSDIKSGYFIGCNLGGEIKANYRNEEEWTCGWRGWRRRRRSRWSGCSGLGLKLTYLRLQLWLVLVWRSSWVHSVVKRLPISLNYIIMQRTSLLTTNRICFHLGYIFFLNRLKS